MSTFCLNLDKGLIHWVGTDNIDFSNHCAATTVTFKNITKDAHLSLNLRVKRPLTQEAEDLSSNLLSVFGYSGPYL